MPYRRTPDPPWFATLDVGHVLREGPSGPFRIVRAVSRHPSGDGGTRLYVKLTIRKASWTGRAYTCITGSDLKSRHFQLVPCVRVKIPKNLLDVRIAQALHQPCRERYIITAREVVGIP